MNGRRVPLVAAVVSAAATSFSCVRDSKVDFRQALPSACRVAGTICSVGFEDVGDGPAISASFALPRGM